MDEVITIGRYALPFAAVLAAALAVFYSFFDKADGSSHLSKRVKNGIACLLGVAFGWYLMLDQSIEITAKSAIAWSFYGFLEGAAAVGIYKTVQIMRGKN
jgi:hypothetical protein